MTPNEYQQLAARTLIDAPDAEYTGDEIMMVWNAIGLAGEAGEVADHIKKGVFHRHGIDKDKLKKELGDNLWYIAALCTKLGVTLEDVMELNIDKLRKRYPDGYSSTASQTRADVTISDEEVEKAFWSGYLPELEEKQVQAKNEMAFADSLQRMLERSGAPADM